MILTISLLPPLIAEATDDLESRLSDGHASEVDTCLLEAHDQGVRSGLHLPVCKGDHLISPVASTDPEENGTL